MPEHIRTAAELANKPKALAKLTELAKQQNIPLDRAILKVITDDNGKRIGDVSVEEIGPISSTVMGAVTGLPAAVAGAAVGVGAGGAATLAGGPAAGFVGGLAAGAGTGMAVQKGTDWLLSKVMPETARRQEVRRQIWPKFSLAGNILSGGAAQKNLLGRVLAHGAAAKGNAIEMGRRMALDPELAVIPIGKDGSYVGGVARNLGAAAGIGAGQDILMQQIQNPGGSINIGEVLTTAALSPVAGGGSLRFKPQKRIADRLTALGEGRGRDRVAGAPEGTPVLLKDATGKPLDPEAAQMLVADKLAADPSDKTIPDYLAELNKFYGETDPQGLLEWRKAVLARREADAEKAKTPEQQVENLTEIAQTEQHPTEFLKWLGGIQFKNSKGEVITLNPKQRLAYAEKDKLGGGQLRARWQAEVAKKEAEAAAEKASKPAKAPKAAPKSSATTAPQPEATTEKSPLQKLADGELDLGKTDEAALQAMHDELSALLSAPIAPDVAADATPILKVLSDEIAKRKAPAAPVVQKTEIPEEYLPILKRVALESMGNLPEATREDYWKNFSGELVKRLSQLPPEEVKNPDRVITTWQTLLRGNRRKETGRVATTPEGAQALRIAEETGQAKVTTADELEGKRLDTENDPTPEPPKIPVTDPTQAELSEEPIPKVVPSKTGPPFDPNNPVHQEFTSTVKEVFGVTPEEHRAKTAGDKWLPNHPSTPVEIVPSDIEGMGNVLTADVEVGGTIGRAFDVDPKNEKAVLQTQLGRFTNHSPTPNAEVVEVNGGLVLKAKENLPAGTELTISYKEAAPVVASYQKAVAEGRAGLINVTRPGTKVKKVKKAKGKKAVATETTAATPTISPAATAAGTVKPTSEAGTPANVAPSPAAAAGEAISPAHLKAIGDYIQADRDLIGLPDTATPEQVNAAQQKLKNAESILRASHGYDDAKVDNLQQSAIEASEAGLSVNDAAQKIFDAAAAEETAPGTPYKPAIKGELGGIGALGDVARASVNVARHEFKRAKDYLSRINRGFEEGRSAADRPEFIRSSVIDVLRPGVLKMGLDKDGRYNGDELLGRLSNTMHPVEKQILLDNGLEYFLKGERRTPEEVAEWMEKNGPQVEVKKLYAGKESSKSGAREALAAVGHELDTISPGWAERSWDDTAALGPRQNALIQRYRRLEGIVFGEEDTANESATARYTMVNPKPLRDMPGAVDILVRIPLKKGARETIKGVITPDEEVDPVEFADLGFKYQSSHYPNEGQNLLAHVRGYMETLPDGRKVFHVFEVQSDWAQKYREHPKIKDLSELPANYKVVENSDGTWDIVLPYDRVPDEPHLRGRLGTTIARGTSKEGLLADFNRKNVAFDPLLKDYNRLALKAAIEHAYRNDADAIAISDAETAMMTEGHDRAANTATLGRFATEEEARQFQAQNDPTADVFYQGWDDRVPWAVGKKGIEQEPGMRFNYDPNPASAGRSGKPGALHELAAELTKYPGERVSFGEHQNAIDPQGADYVGQWGIEGDTGARSWYSSEAEARATERDESYSKIIQATANDLKGPRANLIFRNPDGTPKTDVTAQLYPLDKVAAKLDTSPFGIVGKGPKGMVLYSFPGPLHKPIIAISKAIVKAGGKLAYNASERFIEGSGERLAREAGPSGGYVKEYVAPRFFRLERQLQQQLLDPVFQAMDLGLTPKQRVKLGRYAYDMYEYGASPLKLSANELKAYSLLRKSFDTGRIEQSKDGPWRDGKPISGPTQHFVPQSVLDSGVREVLLSNDHTNAAARKRYETLYAQWYRQQSPQKPGTPTDVYEQRIADSLGELLGKDPFMGKRNPTFTPLYEHEGIGLPPAMREKDIIKLASHYGRRWAAGLAWYRAVQKDPIAARIFGVANDGRGNDYVSPTDPRDIDPAVHSNASQYLITDYTPIPEYARNLSGMPDLEAYRGQMFKGASQHYDWVDNATAVVNAFKLGPKTAFRDLVASSVGVMGEIASPKEAGLWIKSWGDVLSGKSTAVEEGAVRGRSTAEFAIEDSVRNLAGKIADVMRKYQGRDLMEKGIREFLFEFGKEVTQRRIRLGDTDFLETYGGKQWQKLKPDELLTHAATRFMEMMQGSYTPEYLPRSLTISAGPSWAKATFSLSRWGIERFRRYRQTVIRPLAEGNAKPFLKSTAMYLGLAAPAVEALEEWLTKKKPKESSWGEYFNLVKNGRPDAHLMDEMAYDVLAKASLTGMAGILGGIMYNVAQIAHGEQSMGFGNPAVSAVTDLIYRAVDYTSVYSGADWWKNIWRLPVETLVQETQGLRLLKQALDERPDTGRREERIYERVRGKTKWGIGTVPRSNPFSPLTKIRRAGTAAEIAEQGEDLQKMYEGSLPERPSRFSNQLRMPDESDVAANENFYRFTTAMQSPEKLKEDPTGMRAKGSAGRARLEADAAQTGLNQSRTAVANIAWAKARQKKLAEVRGQ